MEPISRPAPAAVIQQLIDEAGDITVEGNEYKRAGTVFAARSTAGGIELCLGQEIAEAARRTPGTTASSRGRDWVSLRPSEWDEHALDRLRAWVLSAWRKAGQAG